VPRSAIASAKREIFKHLQSSTVVLLIGVACLRRQITTFQKVAWKPGGFHPYETELVSAFPKTDAAILKRPGLLAHR
jgi:hypothetical protein